MPKRICTNGKQGAFKNAIVSGKFSRWDFGDLGDSLYAWVLPPSLTFLWRAISRVLLWWRNPEQRTHTEYGAKPSMRYVDVHVWGCTEAVWPERSISSHGPGCSSTPTSIRRIKTSIRPSRSALSTHPRGPASLCFLKAVFRSNRVRRRHQICPWDHSWPFLSFMDTVSISVENKTGNRARTLERSTLPRSPDQESSMSSRRWSDSYS